MKIEYKFVDGTATEVEVDGSLGELMLEMKKEGDRVERKETRRHMSLDGMDFGGEYVIRDRIRRIHKKLKNIWNRPYGFAFPVAI